MCSFDPDLEDDEDEYEEKPAKDEGPGGGAFESWSDFWRYKEG